MTDALPGNLCPCCKNKANPVGTAGKGLGDILECPKCRRRFFDENYNDRWHKWKGINKDG